MSNFTASDPVIHHATSSSCYTSSITDEMFLDRELLCMGDIAGARANSLVFQLRHLEKLDPDGEVTIFINSNGGEVTSGLALYDAMQAVSCPIRTVCLGMAASMAAVLFMAGDQRDMLKHSMVMVHDPLITGGLSGSALSIDGVAKNLMRTREVIADIIAHHTGKTRDEVLQATKSDTFFDAAGAVEWGLADRIITSL